MNISQLSYSDCLAGQAYQPAPAVPDCCNPGGQYPAPLPPPDCCGGGMGQYPAQVPGQYPIPPPPGFGQAPPQAPPAGCCGAGAGAGATGGLLVPLLGQKGEKNGFLRIGQHGSITKLPPPQPKLPPAEPEAQGASPYGAPSPYDLPQVPGQGGSPYGAPAQSYGQAVGLMGRYL